MEKAILTPSSPQFTRLEYALQLSLKASTARIKRALVVSNPSWTIQFEKRTSTGVMTVDTWVDPLEMTGSTSEDELLKRLSTPSTNVFAFPNAQTAKGTSSSSSSSTGLKIRVGKQTFANTNQKITKTVLYCRVGIGRAYCVDSKAAASGSNLSSLSPPPTGYDSLYLQQESNLKENHHVYQIQESNQILPLYIATFEFDPMEEKRSRERPICDNCEKVVASVYCTADSAHLCKDCDVNLHVTKIAQRHQRTPLGKGSDAFGTCRIHQGSGIEYFCSVCHVPVCIHCKMVGHHSSGEASKHLLVKVSDAFETVLKESSKNDGTLDTRIKSIQRQLSLLKARGKEVETMHQMLDAELDRLYKRAKSQLTEAIVKKKRVLLGDEFELVRQAEEIRQLEEFLEYQRTAVDMYHLLFNWSTHQAMRQSLREFSHFRETIDVQLDLKIKGELAIECEEHSSYESSSSPTRFQQQQDLKLKQQQASAPPMVDLGRLSLRKTSDFFAEALNGLESIGIHERSSVFNDFDMDERSVNATGYEDYC